MSYVTVGIIRSHHEMQSLLILAQTVRFNDAAQSHCPESCGVVCRTFL